MKHLNQIVSDALTLKSTDSGLSCKGQMVCEVKNGGKKFNEDNFDPVGYVEIEDEQYIEERRFT